MKNNFIKGFIAGAFLFGTIASFATSYNVANATFPILIDGQLWESSKPALIVDGSTYLPLKAIGEALNVEVNWNSELNQVEISKSNSKASLSYIGNTNTMKYHVLTCRAIKEIAEQNKIILKNSELAGYSPCLICNP